MPDRLTTSISAFVPSLSVYNLLLSTKSKHTCKLNLPTMEPYIKIKLQLSTMLRRVPQYTSSQRDLQCLLSCITDMHYIGGHAEGRLSIHDSWREHNASPRKHICPCASYMWIPRRCTLSGLAQRVLRVL